MEQDTLFWQTKRQLIQTNVITVDRPIGTPHPHYPALRYPLNYGSIENTTAGNGDSMDVWIGSLDSKTLTGILCTFDTIKSDAEIKLLLGCTLDDASIIQQFNNTMFTIFIPNPMVSP